MKTLDTLTNLIASLTRLAAGSQSAGMAAEGFPDLSMRQIYYLETISRLSNPTPTELARKVEVTRPSISAALDKLERLGLIRKAGSDDDRRSYHLHLTSKGEEIAKFHDRIHRQMAERLVAALTPQESEDFLWLVKKIDGQISE